MHPYIQEFQQYLSKYPLLLTNPDIFNALDFLYQAYTQDHPIDSPAIQRSFQKLDSVFDQLSFDDANLLFSTVCFLCLEHEEIAFKEGVKVGFLFSTELK